MLGRQLRHSVPLTIVGALLLATAAAASWPFEPPTRPSVPAVQNAQWPVNEPDAFILAKLEANNLQPAKPAGRPELLRRVTFDVLGLPPTPEETKRFLADSSPDAYARLVDRLLASPHYGERWARHWFDVIRFGESQGFELDRLRPNAWKYRDWVVQALNDDMPFDEFVRLQIAGDILRPNDPTAVIATGFLVAGPWDEIGQTQQSEVMRADVRQEEIEDLVATVGQTFLGLTVNCARCHDHKYDPISQKDYFQFAAALAGVRHGDRASLNPAGEAIAERQRQADRPKLEALTAQLHALEEPIRNRLLAARQQKSASDAPAPIASWEFDDNANDPVGSLHASLAGAAKLQDGRLVLDGKGSFAATEPIKTRLANKTLEAWVALDTLDQRGRCVVGIQSLDGKTFDAIAFGQEDRPVWFTGSERGVRTKDFEGPPESEVDKRLVHVAIVYHADYTVRAYRDGKPYGKPYEASDLKSFRPGAARIVFGASLNPTAASATLAGAIDRARLYDKALSPEEIAAAAQVTFDNLSDDEIRAEMSPEQRRQRDVLVGELSRLESRQRLIAGGDTYAIVPQQPGATRLLRRGDPRLAGEIVSPASLSAIAAPAFELSAEAPESERRIALANWLADSRNPLTARVMVNRVWQWHFGAGLVATPNDLGANGSGQPSHPELIDWLASEFVRDGWSLKRLHRRILLSATYRQSALGDPRGAKVDGDNHLLWRMAPRRLEAEEIRDAVLVVAGELNPAMGGPGFADFTVTMNKSQLYEPADPIGYGFQRRSLYRTWTRSGTNPLLDAFDCPDPSTRAPVRAKTTTPTQALALLNDGFMLRMAERFAERLVREAGHDLRQQIELASVLAFARPSTPAEVSSATAFIRQHGLAAYCRVLFASNEFTNVD